MKTLGFKGTAVRSHVKTHIAYWLLPCIVGLLVDVAFAKVELASPFADGVVLQRDRIVPVWGWADSGEKVTLSFADQVITVIASASGKWRVDLKPMLASKEGRTLSVTSVHPNGSTSSISVSDVLVGEVWYCSGQSNAECPIWGGNPRFRDRQGATVAQMTVKPLIRYCYASDYKRSDVPRERARYQVVWRPFTPENLMRALRPNGTDGFSSMAVYFALDLYSALDVPIGIVGSWWGATRIEPWTPACGFELAGVKPIPDKTRGAREIDQPCKMWNEMVEPWCPMAMRGLIWYQGCSNSSQPETYVGYMHALYRGWAAKFENPEMKLYFVQLASWGAPCVVPLQEAQSKFASEEPNAGLVIIGDVGNLDDIHPNDKQIVGRRLALKALKYDYGFAWIECDSPVLRDWRTVEDKFVLEFDHAESYYFYNPDRSARNGFEICGADGVWHPAEYANGEWYTIWLGNIRNGNLLGNNVVVRAPGVTHPKKLRYLHSAPWFASLYNQANLPIGPFHVDTPNSRGRTDLVLTGEWLVERVAGNDKRLMCRHVLPDPMAGHRQFVRFKGAFCGSAVKVNGKVIGSFSDASAIFARELTDDLEPSGNEIEIEMEDNVEPEVHFIETDRVCIDSITEGRDNIVVDANAKTGEVVVRIKVLSGTNEVQRCRFPSPKLWTSENPNTYYYTARINQGGAYDAITVPFVFKEKSSGEGKAGK